jgi:hypothetical protein
MNLPILFVGICFFFRKNRHIPIRLSKQGLIDECKRLGAPFDGTSRILRHRISRLKNRL